MAFTYTRDLAGRIGGRASAAPRFRAARPRFFSSYLRTAALMAGLVALLAVGGRAVGGAQGTLLSMQAAA